MTCGSFFPTLNTLEGEFQAQTLYFISSATSAWDRPLLFLKCDGCQLELRAWINKYLSHCFVFM